MDQRKYIKMALDPDFSESINEEYNITKIYINEGTKKAILDVLENLEINDQDYYAGASAMDKMAVNIQSSKRNLPLGIGWAFIEFRDNMTNMRSKYDEELRAQGKGGGGKRKSKKRKSKNRKSKKRKSRKRSKTRRRR